MYSNLCGVILQSILESSNTLNHDKNWHKHTTLIKHFTKFANYIR